MNALTSLALDLYPLVFRRPRGVHAQLVLIWSLGSVGSSLVKPRLAVLILSFGDGGTSK